MFSKKVAIFGTSLILGVSLTPAINAGTGKAPESAGLVSVSYLPVNTSKAPRYAEPVSVTNNGLVFVASEGALTESLRIWYSTGSTQYDFAPYEHSSRLSISIGTSIYTADLGDGTDQAIWLGYDGEGNYRLFKAVLGPAGAQTNVIINGGVEGEWPDSLAFVGATKDTLWWAQASESGQISLATSPVSDPRNFTENITNLGDSLDFAQFTADRALFQHTRNQVPINGKYTRISVYPNQPASFYPTDSNVIGTAPEPGSVHGLQLGSDGVTWLTAFDIPGVPNTLSLHTFSPAKLSTLATTLPPYSVFTSYLSDPSGGKGWYLVQEGSGEGFFDRGDGPIRAINLNNGNTAIIATRAFGSMPSLPGRVFYYNIADLEIPVVTQFTSDSSYEQVATVERRPRTVDAIAVAGDTLAISEQVSEDGVLDLAHTSFDPIQPDLLPGPTYRIKGVQPYVPSNVRNRNEALAVGQDGIYTLGSTDRIGDNYIDGIVAVDMGNTVWWAKETFGAPTALRGISQQRLLTRTINDTTNTLRTRSPFTGAVLQSFPGTVAEATSGPNLFTVPSNSIGQVNRVNTLTGDTEQFFLEQGCTPLLNSAAGAYLLYECSGTAKVALFEAGSQGETTVKTASLPNGYDWALGDGFLGYRSIQGQEDTSVSFGWVALGDLSDLRMQFLDSSTLYSTPTFAVDATGGQRMVWSKGMSLGIARFDVTPSGPAPSTPVSAGPGLSPNGDGIADVWSATTAYDSALDWLLAISDTSGKEVYRSSGTAATGYVDAQWDGRKTPNGPVLPDGNYTWSLSLSLPYGSDVSVTTGVLGLRTVGADSQISVPVGVFGPSASFSWSKNPPLGVTGWNVSSRTATMGTTGRITYGPWTNLLTNTTRDKTVVGSASKPLPRGAAVEVRVLPIDELGLPGRNTTKRMPVAFDDTNFTFGTGWTKSKFTSAYFGTLASTTRKTTATRVFNGTSFTLYGQKAPKHGIMEVWVDGKRLATVDTASKKVANKATLWKSPKLKPGRHTVQIRTLATKNRAKIVLDALLINY